MALLIKTMDTDGMCNRLFPFAHLIAFAAEFNHTVEHLAFAPYANYFNGSQGSECPRFSFDSHGRSRHSVVPERLRRPAARLRRRLGIDAAISLQSGQAFRVDPESVSAHLGKQHALQLTGFYFDSTDCFLKHAEVVKKYFAPAAAFEAQVNQFWEQLHRTSETTVGVHIRHGDYLKHAGGLLWYSEREYAELMHQIVSIFPNQKITFLIASNAELDFSSFEGLSVVKAPGHELLDLYCLARCDYLIGPDSTYTEWASFYGNVPRYVHRKKAMEYHEQKWTAPSPSDFSIHRHGFSRCTPGHPGFASLSWVR
jgi:hypothetical protein